MALNERQYIAYRKIKALGNRICFHLCRIFPIRKNLISVCTFEGKGGFGCNPKYLVQELHKRNPDYQFVWFVNDMDKEFPDYVKKVPNTLWSRAYWLSVSKVWIDNYRKPYGTCKRKKQYYLNVNHYTIGIKSTGLLRGDGFSRMAYLVSKNDSDMIDGLVIDSAWCEQCFERALIYQGNFLKTGSPRCDVLYGDKRRYREKFRRKQGLPPDAKVVMFAPTFREGAKNGKRSVYSEAWSIDFKRLLESLERRFGGVWYICVRVHPQLAPVFHEYKNEAVQGRLIDESQADDMYEILAGMDAYITDYSSACFEAGFAEIPVFIFADDIQRYADSRNLMWNLASDPLDHITNNKDMTPELDLVFPFPVATDNAGLEKIILMFNEESYRKELERFRQVTELIFDGRASEKLAQLVERELMR